MNFELGPGCVAGGRQCSWRNWWNGCLCYESKFTPAKKQTGRRWVSLSSTQSSKKWWGKSQHFLVIIAWKLSLNWQNTSI